MSSLHPQKVGLFGGAFDPPHRTHVAVAQAAVEQLHLDVLHVVPTGHAWHKQRPLTAAQHRLEMCRLAFADVNRAMVDGRETCRSGPTYTIDTLQELQARRNEASKEIGAVRKAGGNADALQAEVAAIKTRLPEVEEEERSAGAELERLLTTLPNPPAGASSRLPCYGALDRLAAR